MIRRRFTGILVALLLVHLTWIGNDPACADQSDGGASMPTATGDVAHHHGPASSDDARAPSPNAPVSSQCCAAMASCAVALIAAPATERGDLVATASNALAASAHTRSFGIPAPDPPPPKA
jgi:hypothetical protein